MFQLVRERDGVVLEVYTDLMKGRFEWVRLRKFWTEGDVKLFRDTRAPRMTDNEVKMLTRQYNAGKLYGQNKQGIWHVTHHIDKPQSR